MKACYERGLAKKATLAGTVTVVYPIKFAPDDAKRDDEKAQGGGIGLGNPRR
jgi:hypothetical protein